MKLLFYLFILGGEREREREPPQHASIYDNTLPIKTIYGQRCLWYETG